MARASRSENLYNMNSTVERAAVARENNDLVTWHGKFGHPNENDLERLFKQGLVVGANVNFRENLPICEICILGKQCASSFTSKLNTAKDLLELVHSDMCGPMRIQSMGGAEYLATFTDDYSKWMEPASLTTEDEVKAEFLKFENQAETKHGKKVKEFRTDGSLEYNEEKF